MAHARKIGRAPKVPAAAWLGAGPEEGLRKQGLAAMRAYKKLESPEIEVLDRYLELGPEARERFTKYLSARRKYHGRN